MAKKNSIEQHLVQAYQSPYNQQLFSLGNKGDFEKHLREEARFERGRNKAAEDKKKRLDLWTTLRHTATCVEDLPGLLSDLPPELGAYYRKNAFFKSSGNDDWVFTPEGKTTLAAESTTHASPLGQPTNWAGQDKTRPVYLLGLSGRTKENLNYNFSEAKRESGIEACNNVFVLFADDWPFVAKMALAAAFAKTIKVPEKHRPYNAVDSGVTQDYKRFWEDINKYSIAHVGMSYEELRGMRDTLGLTAGDLKSMITSHEAQKTGVAPGMQLVLPEGLEEIAMLKMDAC